jgi:predicted GIY-YIG superfamily endonuclease
MTGTVYLLHFDKPFGHARHYIGWARNLDRRLAYHGTLSGARLLYMAAQAGVTWQLARTWEDVTKNRERQLKNKGGASRMCPLCGITPARKAHPKAIA